MDGQSISKTIGHRAEMREVKSYVPGLGRAPRANSGFIRSLCVVIFASVPVFTRSHTHRTIATMHTSPRPFVTAAAAGADIPVNAVSCSRRCTFCCAAVGRSRPLQASVILLCFWFDSISITVKFPFFSFFFLFWKTVRYLLIYSNALSEVWASRYGIVLILVGEREQARANARNQ